MKRMYRCLILFLFASSPIFAFHCATGKQNCTKCVNLGCTYIQFAAGLSFHCLARGHRFTEKLAFRVVNEIECQRLNQYDTQTTQGPILISNVRHQTMPDFLSSSSTITTTPPPPPPPGQSINDVVQCQDVKQGHKWELRCLQCLEFVKIGEIMMLEDKKELLSAVKHAKRMRRCLRSF